MMYFRHTFMLYLNKNIGQNFDCPLKYRILIYSYYSHADYKASGL